MQAQQAIEYIHSLYRKGAKPGLERMKQLLGFLGNPQQELKFLHIAGTNGKGSTAAMTASILCKAGYRAGLYTSPFIYRFHERIQFAGRQITDEELVPIVELVQSFVPKMEDPPTEFEFVTAVAMEYYRRMKADIVVLEVGLGGLVDPTNVIGVPEVAVITNIGLDHTEILGQTVEEIAAHKAGIFKEGGTAVVYRSTPSVEAVFEEICAQRKVKLYKADFAGLRLLRHGLEGQVFDCGQRKELELPLLGDHQLHNAAVVLRVADALIENGWKITEEQIREGIRTVSWPGRFDILHRDPLFIIDGGHNPQCIEALGKNITDYLSDRRIIVLMGVLEDKDFGQMCRPVLPLVSEFVCVTPDSPRKLEASQLARYLQREGAAAVAAQSVEQGVRLAMEKAGKDGVVLCFGSLYLLGDVRLALDASI